MRKHTLKSKSDIVFQTVNAFFLLLILFLCAYPLYYTIVCSISDPYSVAKGQINFYPVGLTIQAYQMVFTNSTIWTGYLNSIIYAVFGTIFNLILTIPLAYALSKKYLYGKTFLTWFFLFTMYFSGGMIPTYLLVQKMGLLNTPLIMIITGGVSIYNMIVSRVYFQNNVPESLYEAARIDGCTEFGIFFKIVLPVSKPIIAVIALYYAVTHWNDYFSALIYVTNKAYQPLQLILRRILIQNESAIDDAMVANISAGALQDAAFRSYIAMTMKFSLVFIASAPMLIAYPFVQKYFVKGVMIGSVKG